MELSETRELWHRRAVQRQGLTIREARACPTYPQTPLLFDDDDPGQYRRLMTNRKLWEIGVLD